MKLIIMIIIIVMIIFLKIKNKIKTAINAFNVKTNNNNMKEHNKSWVLRFDVRCSA